VGASHPVLAARRPGALLWASPARREGRRDAGFGGFGG